MEKLVVKYQLFPSAFWHHLPYCLSHLDVVGPSLAAEAGVLRNRHHFFSHVPEPFQSQNAVENSCSTADVCGRVSSWAQMSGLRGRRWGSATGALAVARRSFLSLCCRRSSLVRRFPILCMSSGRVSGPTWLLRTERFSPLVSPVDGSKGLVRHSPKLM